MPVNFWNDPQGEKYTNAYFSMYPGKSDLSRSPSCVVATETFDIGTNVKMIKTVFLAQLNSRDKEM